MGTLRECVEIARIPLRLGPSRHFCLECPRLERVVDSLSGLNSVGEYVPGLHGTQGEDPED